MAIEITQDGTQIITGEHIDLFRMQVLKQGLKAEARGMRLTRGRSSLSIVKQETGLKARTAAEMLPKFEAWLSEKSA